MSEENLSLPNYQGNEIAIIGMAGRFPGARNIKAFWDNLINGIEAISFFDKNDAETWGLSPDVINDPHFVRAGGILDDVEDFDAEFFNFYPKEAAITDPQHRFFLECAWEALENAGYNPEIYKGWIGVFAGTGMNTYLIHNLIANSEIIDSVNGYQLTISNDKDFLSTRVSYKMNLRGPSVSVQTACSTSLVATHLACQSLINYQCDIALAGGVQIRLPQKQGYLYQEGGILSPDGHCRAFDSNAQGTVGGNGVGIVVLKRLEEAIAEGDNIYAVIKGSAVNNDGSSKVGYTAPSVDGQAEVIAMAQAVANIEPETISYIETHGTGTSLGDPIEITALTQVFRNSTENSGFCAIGSVKPNVGHLDAAAGVTSLIKTALALNQRTIPPSINFNQPNPKIDFDNSPFYVNTIKKNWVSENGYLRAGVSSFGIGGTNCHIILEDAPQQEKSSESRPYQLLMVSARTETALETTSQNITNFINENKDIPLADIAFTLQSGRKVFRYRKFTIASNHSEAIDGLNGKDINKQFISEFNNGKPQIVFMFPGQGSQYVNMARDLYINEPVFRKYIDRCSEKLMKSLSKDIRLIFYPEVQRDEFSFEDNLLRQTEITQPALFAIEYSLSQLLISWGIKPSAAIGHSIGEYVAATLAGVFSLDDALEIVSVRGKLMQEIPSGSMLSVSLDEKEIMNFLDDEIALAAINGPDLCVVSGPDNSIKALIDRFNKEGIIYRKLHTSHAFHSPMMDPIIEKFSQIISKFDLHPPKMRFISNLTGTWITPEQAMSPRYWSNHLRYTVRFSEGIDELIKDPSVLFLEVGPGRSLNIFVKSHKSSNIGRMVYPTIRHPQDSYNDHFFLLTSLGKLWLTGVEINWNNFYSDEKRNKIPLPTYPFERQKFWVNRDADQSGFNPGTNRLQKKKNLDDWFYIPTWKRQPWLSIDKGVDLDNHKYRWLVFGNDEEIDPFTAKIYEYLIHHNQDVIKVRFSTKFDIVNNKSYLIDPDDPNSYINMVNTLQSMNWYPTHILHLWLLGKNADIETVYRNGIDHLQSIGFMSLINLAKALEQQQIPESVQISIVISGLFDVFNDEQSIVGKSTVLGASRVISQEYQNLLCQVIDIGLDIYPQPNLMEIITKVIVEVLNDKAEHSVAFRNKSRWVNTIESGSRYITHNNTRLKDGGKYLITGGLGRIGLIYASYLGSNYHANLILVDKSGFPRREKWDDWLESHLENDPISWKITKIKEIESFGKEVKIFSCNLAESDEVKELFNTISKDDGYLNGIFHLAGFVGEDSIISIHDLTKENYRAHLEAKVFGLENLALSIDETPKFNDNLDFVVLQSSLSTVLGGLGLSAYSAVNHYMNSFANVKNKSSKYPWITVDWDGWKFPEINQSETSIKPKSLLTASALELAMTPDEGLIQFEKIMNDSGVTHWIISTVDLDLRIKQWIQKSKKELSDPVDNPKGISNPRPRLQNPYLAPNNEIEKKLADIWSKILGIELIGVYDDFFELGGHSLLATQLVTRVRDSYHVELPLRRLFESPTIAGLAKIVYEYQHQNEELEIEINPIPRNGTLPLSFGQQRLWFLDQLDPSSPLYNNFTAFRLDGELNLDAFKNAINHIVNRHESLRTIFQENNGQPSQVILPWIEIPFYFHEVSMELVNSMALDESQKPFNLHQPPLFRITVLKLDPKIQVIFLTAHHIISDGWSVNIMVNELVSFYSSYIENETPQKEPLRIQYVDYAAWQRKWITGDFVDQQIKYWKSALSGILPSIDLPIDHPRPLLQSSRGSSKWFEFSEDLSSQLMKFSREEGVTVFMVLVAVLNILLHNYTQEEDIVIGTPVANRNRLDTEELIGFFLNIVILRNILDDKLTIRDFLNNVKTGALSAYEHQDLPFEILVDALQPQRDMSHSPLFQVILDFQDTTQQEIRIPGLLFSRLNFDSGTSKYDLAISIEDHGNMLDGYFNYNLDLFDAATIDRFILHFTRILRIVIEQPELTIGNIDVLDEAERNQLIYDWNTNRFNFDENINFIDVLAAQVKDRPDEIAVICDQKQLTYSELDQLSNIIANQLRTNGVKPEVVVGLLSERSIMAIIGMIGIWKAGGVYLPLDPGSPIERLSFYLDDARTFTILTQKRQYDTLKLNSPELFQNRKIVFLDEIEKSNQFPTMEIGNSEYRKPNPENIAYIIYTSGSTGKPKGVLISYGAISEHLLIIKDKFEIVPQDRVLQFSAYSFDQSIEQILVTLISGAQLILRGPELWEPGQFSNIIREFQLTVVNIQPAYWQQWSQSSLRMFNNIENDQLRLVIIGGDVVSPDQVKLWWQTPMQKARLLNAYGPTETTITASTFEIPWNINGKVDYLRIPIGKPLPNRYFYVLNQNQKPVPLGVVGELYIGGSYLAKGYLNQDDLTKEKFVLNPFEDTKDPSLTKLMYRTGDLVRYLPSGDIEFIGRADFQVKIRGFRIELGEIEALIKSHPNIDEAIVMMKTGKNNRPSAQSSKADTTEKRLVALITLRARENETAQVSTELRNYLKNHLPAYMVPSTFIVLDKMPYLPSGKIDRKTLNLLPEPESIRPELDSNFVSPRTPVEKELALVWSEILGVQQIGIYDSFFELGGHSLLATQIISRLRDIYHVDIPLRLIFESPTIETLATAIAQSLVSKEVEQSGEEDIEKLLAELEGMSDEEIKKLLESEETD